MFNLFKTKHKCDFIPLVTETEELRTKGKDNLDHAVFITYKKTKKVKKVFCKRCLKTKKIYE